MAPKKQSTALIIVIICLLVILAGLVGTLLFLRFGGGWFSAGTEPTTEPTTSTTEPTTKPTDPTTKPTQPTTQPTEPTTEPTEPPVIKVGTATIANVGDFLMHLPVINSADISDGNYDFANALSYIAEYIQSADYAVGNLETNLAGSDYKFWYNNQWHVGYYGYPVFNCPDGIVSSVQAAGFDMLLTANNHSYDTRDVGFYRTQQILQALEMDYLGTSTSTEQPRWQIRQINGIQIGMLCYTYETDDNPDKVALNGIPMSSTDAALVCTFSYGQLDLFYEEMEQNISEMTQAGAEAIVLYIHWGDEYQLKQNSTQSTIAQKMCDLGVDVIVGGHPHVVQPMELLTSSTDESHKTVCLYSTGNILSNQRREYMTLNTGHTEDGVVFHFTFAKYSDGTVILESAGILPTWVDLHYNAETGKNVYSILPLDTQLADWMTQFGLNESRYNHACASYSRTMDIVGSGLEQVQSYLAQLVAETEEALGVTP